MKIGKTYELKSVSVITKGDWKCPFCFGDVKWGDSAIRDHAGACGARLLRHGNKIGAYKKAGGGMADSASKGMMLEALRKATLKDISLE